MKEAQELLDEIRELGLHQLYGEYESEKEWQADIKLVKSKMR